MANLYNNLDPHTFSVNQFARHGRYLLSLGDEEQAQFIQFAVTGEFCDNSEEEKKQVFLDPTLNRINDPNYPLDIARDYDSALGFADDILVNGSITVYAVPHPTFALTSSIHMKYPLLYRDAIKMVEYHHIPNYELGTFGDRCHINVFFPLLWDSDRSKHQHPHRLSVEQRAFWYERGFRPAIRTLLGDRVASEWPATLETERIRARKSRGGFAWATKTIQQDAVRELAEQIRQELENDPFLDDGDARWAGNFFFLHTIRGVKHRHYHRVDAESAEHFLTEFLTEAQLSPDAVTAGDWYIDVGIEVSSSVGDCVQWMTASHSDLVQQALRIPEEHANRITRIGSSKYSRDLSSHLTALSGFRIVPGAQAQGEFEATYIQAYTTDKSVVYNPEGRHHAKFLTTKEALSCQDHPTQTIGGIYSIYAGARDANSSSARLEVRIPFRFATDVLLEFDSDVIRRSVCVFAREDWWDFRIIRLMGFSQAISLQSLFPLSRFQPEALTLTAACVWLINGLHARPDDGPASRKLMDAILPLTEAAGADRNVIAYNTSTREAEQEEEEEEEEEDRGLPRRVPYNPYGCVFLRRVAITEQAAPRLRIGGSVLSGSSFEFWYNGMTLAQVQAQYQSAGIVPREVVAQTRFLTNRAKLAPHVNHTGQPEPQLFHLAAQGHALAPPPADDGSDVDDRSSPPPGAHLDNIDTFLSTLWRTFVRELTLKSPNPHGNTKASYLKLDKVERQSATDDLYKNLHFPQIFTDVYYKNASRDEWRTSFNWLFPDKDFKTSAAIQNYKQCSYYKRWMEFLAANSGDAELIKASRDELFKRIREWSWMPSSQSDRMWMTSAKKASGNSYIRWPRDDARPPAPFILLKSHSDPIFVVPQDN
ncbi:hypothetical protein P691DRAFT_778498 [Macrolepiota fuliginosa MF-IS2]|uniref:Uncharacterized protein n=1 Tax=Macrolepiota fuliginosa MF-IS2 TaxID=1400762 RepID=A0A9P6BYC7_9AGAR|nr:hypothetical protein P691DRAFT_778498 [Macrolepiota fuliginosa MF-IS2]